MPATPPHVPSAALSTPQNAAPASLSAPAERVFCNQSVGVRLTTPDSTADRYRPFVGVFSDASWTPQLCAALVVESVTPDGIARIDYVFGPMGSNSSGPGGVLRGTGIIRDGELRFQNSDGSQFAFRPLYSDLSGTLTTPQGQTYQTVFVRTP